MWYDNLIFFFLGDLELITALFSLRTLSILDMCGVMARQLARCY